MRTEYNSNLIIYIHHRVLELGKYQFVNKTLCFGDLGNQKNQRGDHIEFLSLILINLEKNLIFSQNIRVQIS